MSEEHDQQYLVLRDQYNENIYLRYLKQLNAQQEFLKRYVQVMVSIGYLGFLAIWAGVSKDLPVWSRSWSGGLMTISGTIYIAYELSVSMITVKRINEIADVGVKVEQAASNADPEGFRKAQNEWLRVEERDRLNQNRVQPPVFYLSAACGLFAGAILVVGLLQNVAPDVLIWFKTLAGFLGS